MSKGLIIAAAIVAGLSLASCDALTKPTEAASSTTGKAATPELAPLTPNGTPVPITAENPTDQNLQYAAGVVKLDPIPEQNAKLFGTAGGDPAMNGLDTHIGFYVSPADGWAIYKLGDFLDYTLLSTAPGRVDLDIHESTFDGAKGEIGDRHRRVIVRWTPGAEDGPPSAVTLTPAA